MFIIWFVTSRMFLVGVHCNIEEQTCQQYFMNNCEKIWQPVFDLFQSQDSKGADRKIHQLL